MEPHFSPSNHIQKTEQVPLFVSDLPEGDKDLSEKNITDLNAVLLNKLTSYVQSGSTISGRDFLQLFKDAASFDINDATLKKYLKAHNIVINSNNSPEEPINFITYH